MRRDLKHRRKRSDEGPAGRARAYPDVVRSEETYGNGGGRRAATRTKKNLAKPGTHQELVRACAQLSGLRKSRRKRHKGTLHAMRRSGVMSGPCRGKRWIAGHCATGRSSDRQNGVLRREGTNQWKENGDYSIGKDSSSFRGRLGVPKKAGQLLACSTLPIREWQRRWTSDGTEKKP